MALAFEDWTGRTEERTEHVAREPFVRLAAMLDRENEAGEAHVPPLGHWLCFLPEAPQADLGPDGHPRGDGLYPPISLPMRMWAGSRLRFHAPIAFGALITRRSTLLDMREKKGRSGPLAFLTVRHEVRAGEALCVTEDLDIVFRDRSGPRDNQPGERRIADVSRTIEPTSALLFRYSALTFNAHRIHYDRDYATKAEGYPGLVVHGPLLATLLMDHFERHRPGETIRAFEFRAERPVYDLAPFTVNLIDTSTGAQLWANDADGFVAMSATIEAGWGGTER
ncbi:MAG: MaoC family dehydratase N-terminal domain-containing protein [Alphaproteobacteria bacterium]|mgnify:CR=1 FL=1|nr:MaoC family dehydratase N-terminal domain-containing protein [Alphaproteobacteria bacterium]